MSFDSEYLALRKKREKEKEKKKQELMRSKPYASKLISSADEIAPVKTFTPTTTDAPIKSKKDDSKKDDDERTWFKKGSGGVANTILGTVADIGEDIGTGIIGMGEKAVDALAMLGTTMGNAQMSQLSNDELAFSAVKNIGKDKKTKEKEAESIVKKYNTAQKDAKKGTTEFVKKDLYNEEAIAKKIITAPFQKATDINVEASSVLGEKSDALIQSGGQLLAMAGLQAMGVPWFLTTGATSFGAEAENALNQGATFEQATMSAAVSAGAEILTEKLSGGIKFKAPGMKSAKTLDDILVKPFLERISDDVIKKLATIGVDALGEGGEEILSGMFSNLGSALYKEEDLTDILFSKEAWQEYLEGFIGGAALGGFSSSVRAVADRNKIELSENEQKVFDKVVEDRLKEATQDGKTLSKKKEAEIRNAVLRDMLKGYIDTDTIESVLGGEEYEAYKKAKDLSDENIASGNEVIEKLKTAKDTLQAEYDTLYKMKNGEKSDEQIDRQSELKEKIADIDARIEKTQGVIKNLGEDKRLSGLKTKLGQSVYDLVKDSRLGESYNEVSRRKQSFEADLSKYDAKQQETVKKAIESGILNNTNRTHEFVDMIAKISADKGVSFDFTDNQKLKESGFAIEGKTVNGLVTKDGIKINVNSAKALNSVVGHEITHILEGTELYTELQTMLKTVAESKGEYQSRYDEIRKLYEGIENADIEKELTADLVGDYLFTDREFISRLSTEKPGVFKKLFDEIKYLCKVATAGSKEARELEKVKKTFEELYRESRAEKNTADEVKYSVTSKMTEEERYTELKSKQIEITVETDTLNHLEAISSLDNLEKKIKSQAEKIIYPLAEKLGITTKELTHDNIDVEFIFSKTNGLKESLSKQLRYGGNYTDFAKALVNLEKILDNAVLIEVHGDKYKGTSRENENLEAVYVLLGAFKDESHIIPVQMEIKKSSDVGGRLYMTVALTKIEADVLGSTPENIQTRSLISASTYSISDIVQKINPKDAHFLKYIPDKMLSTEQIQAKKVALAEDAEKIKKYRWEKIDKDYLKAIKKGDTETTQKMVDEAAKSKGYDSPILYHGTHSFGFTSFDLDKMDDKRSIFLTSNEKIASTYSGVTGLRKIGKGKAINVADISAGEIVKALNEYDAKYKEGTTEGPHHYELFDFKKTNSLINTVNEGIEKLKTTVDGEIKSYAEKMAVDFDEKDAKIHRQLVALKERLDRYDYQNLSTPIYLLLHHTDVFNGSAGIAELEKNIRLMNQVRTKDLSTGVIVDEALGGYVIEVMDIEGARDYLESRLNAGNYSLYAKLGKSLVIDGKGALWKDIRNWSSAVEVKASDVDIIKKGDFYELVDRNTQDVIEGGSFAVNSFTDELYSTNKARLRTLMVSNANSILHINTETLNTTRDIAKYAKEHGYDSVVFKNIIDNGGWNSEVGYDELADIYVIFDEKAVKSADAVTYDDNGNVIPLSKRFNTEKKDIRYSLSSKETTPAKHGDYVVYGEEVMLEGEAKLTGRKAKVKARPADIAPVKEAPATVSKTEQVAPTAQSNVPPVNEDDYAPMTEAEANAMYEADKGYINSFTDADMPPETDAPIYMPDTTSIDEKALNNIAKTVKDALSLTTAETKAIKDIIQKYSTSEYQSEAELFEEIRTNFGEKSWSARNEEIANVKQVLRGYKVNVSPTIKRDITDYAQFRRRNFGKITFSKEGIPVDTAYMELSDTYPNFFPASITNATDQLLQMAEVANMEINETQTAMLDDESIQEATELIVDVVNTYKESELLKGAKAQGKEFLKNANKYVKDMPVIDNDFAPIREATTPTSTEPIKATPTESNDAEKKPTRRSELHQSIVDKLKSKFTEKGFDFDEVLSKAKNLSTFATVDNIPQRVMEKALGYKQGQILADETVNKVAQNESEGIKWLNSFTDRKNGVLAQISKQYNIKPGSKKSAAAQMYAEGFYVNKNNEIVEYGDRELALDFPDARVRENIKGLARDPRIRQIYDDTLAAINESRSRNLYPEIPRLDNYFLHFRAMEDTFSRLGLPFNPNDIRAKDLPTDLNGVTADLKPGQPYFASAKHREGMRTSFDLLGGLERYLSSAKNQIYHIDDIQTLRALRNYIADTYGQAKGLESLDNLSEEDIQDRIKQVYGSHLSTFAKFLNEEANVLAGKTTLIDRGLEGVIGRRGITFLNTLNSQVGSNMVGFNASSSLTNILPVVQTMAKTNKFDFVKALAQTSADKIGTLFGKSDGFKESNPVIIRRKGAERFYRTPFQKVGDAGYILMSAVDDVSTEIIARTKYNELTRKGMDSQQAHFETDKWVSRLMGDRSLGQQPQLYNSKTLGLVTKFQLEVRNQLDSQFYDTIQEAKVSNEEIENALLRNAKTAAKVGSTFFQLAVLQHIFGAAFESVAGYNPAFDIIDVLIKTLGFDDDEEDEDTPLDNLEEGFLTLLEDLPYTSTLTGGRIPISSGLPITELIKGQDQYGNEVSRLDVLKEAAPYYVLPTGYGQLKKTAKGLGMFSDEHPVAGSYTDSGNLRFPVEDNLKNRIQAGVFGQYANKNARTYFDEDYAPLKEKQIQEYIDVEMPIKDYWQYREDLKGLDSLEEKFDFIAGMDLPVEKKNILINNIVDRKEKVDLENYDDFENYEEFDFYAKNTEKYNFLQDNNVSYKEYKADEDTKERYDAVYSWWKNYPEKVTVSKAVTDNVIEYRGYTGALDDIRADKDSNGKSISGSAKEKKKAYIWSLDIDDGAKYILFKNEYKADDTYNSEIIDYLNSRDDITYDEMNTICEELGFKVNRDTGYISWD